MKVLWICQRVPPEADAVLGGEQELKKTGGWILGMAGELCKHSNIQLAILASSPLVTSLQTIKCEHREYFILPTPKGESDKYFLEQCKSIRKSYDPTVVHIHGTEYIEGLLWTLANGASNVVVSLQGILTSYAKYYYSGMTQYDVLSNMTLRDIIRGTIFKSVSDFKQKALYEQKLLQRVSFVIGRTFWDKNMLWSINPKAEYFFNNEILRDDFYQGEIWRYDSCVAHSIFVNQAAVPYKGMHQLIKALPIVKLHYPDVTVRVAGLNVCDMSFKRRLLRTGYAKYLIKLMRSLGVESRITFIGPQNAQCMIREMLNANVFLLPSSIENSPNALGEAQILGVPCVSSRVGGVADMIPNSQCGKLYRFSDVEELAWTICDTFEASKIFDNNEMRNVASERHDKLLNSETLLHIYDVISCK